MGGGHALHFATVARSLCPLDCVRACQEERVMERMDDESPRLARLREQLAIGDPTGHQETRAAFWAEVGERGTPADGLLAPLG